MFMLYMYLRYTNQVYGDKLSEVLDKKRTITNEVTDDDGKLIACTNCHDRNECFNY